VEDIAAGNGDFNVEEIGVLGGGCGEDGHAFQELSDFGGEMLDSGACVYVRDFCGHLAWSDVWTESRTVVVFGDDLNWFNSRFLRSSRESKVRERVRCVTGEHCDHCVDDDLKFGLICCCAFNEDVCCVEGYFRKIAIDDRWKTQNMSIGIINDWINRRISNDMQEFSEMFVIL